MPKRPTSKAAGRAGERHVALLRAINVGGRNILPMKDLVALFEAAGCEDVVTYIQSGNVVFRASDKVLATLAAQVEKAITKRFGFEAPVVLRSARELDAVARANPFQDADEDALYVGFLREHPSASRVAALDPQRSKGDEFVVKGREIYMRLATGAAKTKLTVTWFDKELGTVTTVRNVRTLAKLRELSG
jgi:uncharacterized protein (DUF1697 family)